MEDVESEAQLIIVAGFLLAIGVISLAVILNGLIFAHDLSTRDTGLDEERIRDVYEVTDEIMMNSTTGGSHPSGHYNPQAAGDEFDNYTSGSMDYISNNIARDQGLIELSTGTKELVWMVGQKKYNNIKNNSNSTDFRLFNDTSTELEPGSTLIDARINLVELPSKGGGTNFTVFGADRLNLSWPPGVGAGISPDAWAMEINNHNITVNYNFSEVSGAFISSKRFYINETFNETGQLNINILEESVNGKSVDDNGDSYDFVLDASGPTVPSDGALEDMVILDLSNGGVVNGTYDIRVSDSYDANHILNPCSPSPGSGCAADINTTDIHAIGIVHNVSDFKLHYITKDANISRPIDFRTNQSWIGLEGV